MYGAFVGVEIRDGRRRKNAGVAGGPNGKERLMLLRFGAKEWGETRRFPSQNSQQEEQQQQLH